LNNKNIYFFSDAHLGFPNHKESLKRERALVKLLDAIKHDAREIFLLGDIFDFWFEYNKVVPKGFSRLLGKCAELTDSGIKINFFTGNHDMWTFGYLKDEIGLNIYTKQQIFQFDGKKFFIAHGDGLGIGDKAYKRLKLIFSNNFFQWLFARFHPNFSFWIAQTWSHKSRLTEKITDYTYVSDDKERLLEYAKNILEHEHYDFFIFGHRHVPLKRELKNKSVYISLGDWLHHFTYAVYDGNTINLLTYNETV